MDRTITPIIPMNSNMQRMNDAYRANSINNQAPTPKYKPFEEIITVRELLRRLADGKVVLETKIKL